MSIQSDGTRIPKESVEIEASTIEESTGIDVISYQPSEADSGKKFRLSPFKILALILLALLLFALWFVFTAKSVWVQVEPSSDTLAVDGGWLQFQWKDHYLMQPGTFDVVATKQGYYALQEQIEVGADGIQRFQFELVKLPGKIRFEFDQRVENAQVNLRLSPGDENSFVEPEELSFIAGVEPVEVKAGVYQLSISAPRYQTYQNQIEVIGLGQEQSFEIELKPNWADVSVESLPVGASVYIDDEKIGETPDSFEILAGEHQLSLRARGYKNWFRTLNLSAEQQLNIHDIKLVRADGTISISTNPVAAISVNGRYKGVAPQKFKLPPGKQYVISASKVGFGKKSQTVDVRSDQDVVINWELAPLIGQVTLTTQPSNAEIWLDGKRIGTSGQALQLPVTDHDLEIRANGYATKSLRVLPKPQSPQSFQVELLTLQAAREAELARKRVITSADGQTLLMLRPQAFTMGSSRRVRGRRSNETLREVNLNQPYYIATKEVTNQQFKAYSPSHSSGSSFKVSLDDAALPVVNVTWDEAARYCNWLSQRDGLPAAYTEQGGEMKAVVPLNTGYRLLTESEWAWAARISGGRSSTLFPWGKDSTPPKDFGNYADSSAAGLVNRVFDNYNDGFATTAPVGSFEADEADLYDLSGNVSEWTHDLYKVGDYTPGASSRAHIFRGSSWQHSRVAELRPTYRDFSDQGRADLGFRIGRSVE